MNYRHPLVRFVLILLVILLSLGIQIPAQGQALPGSGQTGATFDLVSGGQMAGPNADGVITSSIMPGPDYSLPNPSQVHFFPADPTRLSTFPTTYGHLIASGNSQNAPEAVVAAGVDDRDNTDITGWAVYEHQHIADVSNTVVAGNLRVVDLFVEVPGGDPVFTVTYVVNSGSYARGWAWLADVDSTNLLNYVVTNNMRIIVQKVSYDAAQPVANNRERFYAVMIPNTGADAKSWSFWKNQSVSDLIGHYGTTMRITQINSYVESVTTFYDAVMIANSGADARSWWWYVNASVSSLSTYIATNNARLIDLDIDPASGNFNAIMTGCSSGCPLWWWYVGIPTSDLLNIAAQDGARIIDANSFSGCGDRCWSFILINDSNAITSRVGQILRNGTDGSKGLYLKQVGGAVLANLNDGSVFEPASTIKAVTSLYTMRKLQAGVVNLDTQIAKYTPPASGSCPGNVVSGTESIDLAVQEMMWHSDNTRTRELNDFFGTNNVNLMASSIGMVHTAINHIVGCGGPIPDQTTLDDLGLLYEGVARATLVDATRRDVFFNHTAGKAQFLKEGYDWTGLWSTDLPAIINQEAPVDMTASVRTSFLNQMNLAYKAGNYKICGATCATYVDHISIFGYAKIPFCDAGGPREFVFGIYINNSTSDTTSGATFTAAKSELLREQIHDGLASCNHQLFIKTFISQVTR